MATRFFAAISLWLCLVVVMLRLHLVLIPVHQSMRLHWSRFVFQSEPCFCMVGDSFNIHTYRTCWTACSLGWHLWLWSDKAYYIRHIIHIIIHIYVAFFWKCQPKSIFLFCKAELSGFIASVVKGRLDYSRVIQLGFDMVCGVFAAMNTVDFWMWHLQNLAKMCRALQPCLADRSQCSHCMHGEQILSGHKKALW